MFLFTLFTVVLSAVELTTLPGQPKVNFAQYSGYIDVAPTRSLFWWLQETSDGSWDSKPLLIWLQGGPGCSSLIGAFTEVGAFRVNADASTLSLNPYAWNKKANVLIIESPAGVGYSYDETINGQTGDNQTSADLYAFVATFTQQIMPKYNGHPLFISGESYGGHYVPQLAYKILDQNRHSEKINLKGMLVGNPWTSDEIDGGSTIEWIYMHALCSEGAYTGVKEACGALKVSGTARDSMGFKDYFRAHEPVRQMSARALASCNAAKERVMDEVGNDINQYGIYSDCHHGGPLDCNDYTALTTYLNTPAVMKAFHVRVNDAHLPWSVCGGVNYVESWATVVPLYKTIIPALQHVMVYSGDQTWNCNQLGSSRWISTLGMKTVSPWHAYKTEDDQVAGFQQGFAMHGNAQQFSFATVRGAGHMTPSQPSPIGVGQPERSFVLLEKFFSGEF